MTNCAFDLKEHLTCRLYSGNSFDPLVKTIELAEEQTLRHKSDRCEALLLVSGSIALHADEQDEMTVSETRLLLSPPGCEIYMRGLQPSQLIVCRLTDDVQFCPRIDTSEYQKSNVIEDNHIHILPFRQPIASFTESLASALDNGLHCETYLNCKFTELMFLLPPTTPSRSKPTCSSSCCKSAPIFRPRFR